MIIDCRDHDTLRPSSFCAMYTGECIACCHDWSIYVLGSANILSMNFILEIFRVLKSRISLFFLLMTYRSNYVCTQTLMLLCLMFSLRFIHIFSRWYGLTYSLLIKETLFYLVWPRGFGALHEIFLFFFKHNERLFNSWPVNMDPLFVRNGLFWMCHSFRDECCMLSSCRSCSRQTWHCENHWQYREQMKTSLGKRETS